MKIIRWIAADLCTLIAGYYPMASQNPNSPSEIRGIAKEAYIYDFPIVDEYLTMYAFAIDKSNPQYKGPFNSILNFARVFTPRDTAFGTPNSDTPYTFSAWACGLNLL